jgi:DhnA family fructose-bisphosphate aldolase class Ia
MTQELIELRQSILAGRYDDALEIIDDLEEINKQAILRKIEAFLVRLLIHLIKNQIEQRLTNSWIASIFDSVIQIAKLNLKGNQTSHYIKADEWQTYLEEALAMAIRPASAEIYGGTLKPSQIIQRLNQVTLIN